MTPPLGARAPALTEGEVEEEEEEEVLLTSNKDLSSMRISCCLRAGPGTF
jgi:hypothetical protein